MEHVSPHLKDLLLFLVIPRPKELFPLPTEGDNSTFEDRGDEGEESLNIIAVTPRTSRPIALEKSREYTKASLMEKVLVLELSEASFTKSGCFTE